MKKHLLLLLTAMLFTALTLKAQDYANTAIDSPDGRVKTTYEIQGNTLYYHVHVVLPEALTPEINNGYDQENQAQFWLYVPNVGVIGSFEYCFTTESYYQYDVDPNIQHYSEGNVHDFLMEVDLSGISSADLAGASFQTGLCVIEDPYAYNDQQVNLMLF